MYSSIYFDPYITINDYEIIEKSDNLVFFESTNTALRDTIVTSLKKNFGDKKAQKYMQDYERYKETSSNNDEDEREDI